MHRFWNIAALLTVLGTHSAWADGFALKGIDVHGFFPVVEKEQVAVIAHEAGVQRMVVTTSVDLNAKERAVWLLPVPGTPDTVHVDVWDKLPLPRGRDPVERAQATLDNLFGGARGFSLITAILDWLPALAVSRGLAAARVHEEVDKFGVHVEALTADSLDEIAAYLKGKAIAVDSAALATLEPYVNGEYVIVVSWIASAEMVRDEFGDPAERKLTGDLSERRPCIYVEFPCDRPFFPMRPTRAYGDVTVPLRLFIEGAVRPEAKNALADDIRTTIYEITSPGERRRSRSDTDLPRELIDPGHARYYTFVHAEVFASRFKDDLYFEPNAPASIARAGHVKAIEGPGRSFALALLATVALFSYVSAGLAGIVFFRRWHAAAPLGLYMLLTYLGFILLLRNHSLVEMSPKWAGKTEGYVRRRFAFATVLIFILLTLLAQVGAMIWLHS